MVSTRIIPALLLKNAGLVKTIRFKDPKYIGDPINAVRIFNDKGADELILLDILATREKKEPDLKKISNIASECFMPFAYGGGIRTIEQAQKILALGSEKVIVNSYALENPEFVCTLSGKFGSQSIVISIDSRKDLLGRYRVWSHGGTRNTGIDPVAYAKKMEASGAGEIFLNSIDRDGTMKGYDLELIKQVSSEISIPVVACGGAGTIEDFGNAISYGASAVAAGSFFVFQGPHRAVMITYPEPDVLNVVSRK